MVSERGREALTSASTLVAPGTELQPHMDLRTQRQRVREAAKLALRTRLGRHGLSVGSDPYVNRLNRALCAKGVTTVLDIGANVGQYGALLRAAGFPGRIISVEPLADALVQLHRRSRGDDLWEVVASAAGSAVSETEINVSANSYSSSLRPMARTHLEAAPDSQVIGSQRVQVTTVAELVASRAIDPTRTLLKVDTQGFEGEVLAGAGALLGDFAGIQLEVSIVELYEGQLLVEDITALVRSHGLELWGLEPGFADRLGRMLQYDALFMRAP